MKKISIFMVLATIIIILGACSKGSFMGIETTKTKKIILQALETKGFRDSTSYQPQPGDSIIVRGDLSLVYQQEIIEMYSNNSQNFINLGVMDTTSSVSDFGIAVMIMPNRQYGLAYSALTPEGFEYPLELEFQALIISDQNTIPINLNQIYQSSTSNILPHGYKEYFGYFIGFHTDGDLNISPWGGNLLSDLMDMEIVWDGQADSTASFNGGLIPLPDSLQFLMHEDCGAGMDMIIQCSYSNFQILPMQWDSTGWTTTIKTLPNCFLNLVITDRNNWQVKKYGINATIGNHSTELINLFDYGEGQNSWYLFLFKVVNQIPINVEWFDYRIGTIIQINPLP